MGILSVHDWRTYCLGTLESWEGEREETNLQTCSENFLRAECRGYMPMKIVGHAKNERFENDGQIKPKDSNLTD